MGISLSKEALDSEAITKSLCYMNYKEITKCHGLQTSIKVGVLHANKQTDKKSKCSESTVSSYWVLGMCPIITSRIKKNI